VGDILDVGTKLEIIRKSGSWYYLGDDRLAQGRENVKNFLSENPAITQEIERLIRAQTRPAVTVGADGEAAETSNGTAPAEDDGLFDE
jgi:recombination protein RecA